jgi:hypothetical protein
MLTYNLVKLNILTFEGCIRNILIAIRKFQPKILSVKFLRIKCAREYNLLSNFILKVENGVAWYRLLAELPKKWSNRWRHPKQKAIQ